MHTSLFDYEFGAAYALDIGVVRASNQDKVISCPEYGFFAVSDGMGGLEQGGKTSEIIAEVMPSIVEEIAGELKGRGKKPNPGRYGAALKERVRLVSDNIFDIVNIGSIGFGATLSCVWLVADAAVYVNLGDSRGYLLPRYQRALRQITEDHNVAGELVRLGELTKEEARGHSSSSRLTQFMGMQAPARPDVFIELIEPGDRILICSDGVSGMLCDKDILRVMRSSKWPNAVCRGLVAAANEAGGKDNSSVVYLKIGKRASGI